MEEQSPPLPEYPQKVKKTVLDLPHPENKKQMEKLGGACERLKLETRNVTSPQGP